ncbi:MAG: nuclear transport factor 2 family protein [Nevskiales bacterium]
MQALLAEDVVFHSPVVHTPQQGRRITTAYLSAAMSVLGQAGFSYTRQIIAQGQAALEFSVEIDGIEINGIDIISWNAQGEISEFKVMIRPLKAINLVHQKMAALLESRR